jgi:hypothetical protein
MRPQLSRGGPPPSGAAREVNGQEARAAREAPGGGAKPLPQWESFPPPDRRRLVGLLIQTARRQVQPGPPGPPGAPGRASVAQG